MARQKRSDDNELIEEAEELRTPSHQGSSGGDLARRVGQRDEDKTATGKNPEPTGIEKRDKPKDGDRPTLKQTRL